MKGEDGQAAVELALVTPLLFVVILLVVQVGLIVRDQVLVVEAAREGARAAAVDPTPDAADRAAKAVPGLDPSRLSVRVNRAGLVRVDVEYRADLDVPVVGSLPRSVTLHGTAVFQVEANGAGIASRKAESPVKRVVRTQ